MGCWWVMGWLWNVWVWVVGLAWGLWVGWVLAMMLAMWVGILVVGCCGSVVVAMWILAVWGEILVVGFCGLVVVVMWDGVRKEERERGTRELICLYYFFCIVYLILISCI